MAYDPQKDIAELRKQEKEIVTEARNFYDGIIESLLLIVLSTERKAKKIKRVRDQIRKLKSFNERFVAKFVEQVYKEQHKRAYEVAKETITEYDKATLHHSRAAKVEEIENNLKNQNKADISKQALKEAEAYADEILTDLDSKADYYGTQAKKAIIKFEAANLREEELGYTDGADKSGAGETVTKELQLKDSKGRVLTAATIMTLAVGDPYWKISNRSRSTAWLVMGYQYARHISIIDEATTEICLSLHQRVRDLRKDAIPPLHFGCRSIIVPIPFNDTL